MARATCQCGEILNIPAEGSDRVVCSKCGAKIRVRRSGQEHAGDPDGFIRFACPCGRRLKVRATGSPQAGKCPDCGRTVPIPAASSPSDPETTTQEMSADDLARLDQWAKNRQAQPAGAKAPATKIEAGLRVCPQCKKPVHLNAQMCRACGAQVPKR